MADYILVGDSGHGKVIEDCIVANGEKVIAWLDDRYNILFQDGPYIKGPLSIMKKLLKKDIKVIISIGNNVIRQTIVERLQLKDMDYGIVIHPSAIISPSAKIEYGTVIMPNVVVNSSSKIGSHTILNTGCIIEHDCVIGNFVHISPSTVLTGGVIIGEGTQIGANSSVNPLIKIGNWTMVGAGSAVIRNIPNNVTAVGVPTEIIRKEGLK